LRKEKTVKLRNEGEKRFTRLNREAIPTKQPTRGPSLQKKKRKQKVQVQKPISGKEGGGKSLLPKNRKETETVTWVRWVGTLKNERKGTNVGPEIGESRKGGETRVRTDARYQGKKREERSNNKPNL